MSEYADDGKDPSDEPVDAYECDEHNGGLDGGDEKQYPQAENCDALNENEPPDIRPFFGYGFCFLHDTPSSFLACRQDMETRPMSAGGRFLTCPTDVPAGCSTLWTSFWLILCIVLQLHSISQKSQIPNPRSRLRVLCVS